MEAREVNDRFASDRCAAGVAGSLTKLAPMSFFCVQSNRDIRKHSLPEGD